MMLKLPIPPAEILKKMTLFSRPYLKQFSFNIDMLNYRLGRLSNIDTLDSMNKMEYQMVFDSVMSLLRALLLESPELKKNFTIQNYLREINMPDKATKIDEYLNQPFDWGETSIRNALKFIIDKFICHVDDVSVEDIALCDALISHLENPYSTTNLKKIIDHINGIVGEV